MKTQCSLLRQGFLGFRSAGATRLTELDEILSTEVHLRCASSWQISPSSVEGCGTYGPQTKKRKFSGLLPPYGQIPPPPTQPCRCLFWFKGI